MKNYQLTAFATGLALSITLQAASVLASTPSTKKTTTKSATKVTKKGKSSATTKSASKTKSTNVAKSSTSTTTSPNPATSSVSAKTTFPNDNASSSSQTSSNSDLSVTNQGIYGKSNSLAANDASSTTEAKPANNTTPAPAKDASKNEAPTTATNNASNPLSGNIKHVHIDTLLREVSDTSHHLKRAALDLIGEVERQNLTIVAEPDVIGPMIIPAAPDVTGTIATGDLLPPRKKWVDYFTQEIGKLQAILFSDVNQVQFDDVLQPDATETWNEIVTLIDAIDGHYKNLVTASQAKKLDNLAIGKEALYIYDSMNRVEKLRKKLTILIRHESKELKEASKEK